MQLASVAKVSPVAKADSLNTARASSLPESGQLLELFTVGHLGVGGAAAGVVPIGDAACPDAIASICPRRPHEHVRESAR